MTTTIVSTFTDGRESRRVECSCGWWSASLWADYWIVIDSWAERHAATHAGVVRSVRETHAERARLLAELDRLDRERARVTAALAEVAS